MAPNSGSASSYFQVREEPLVVTYEPAVRAVYTLRIECATSYLQEGGKRREVCKGVSAGG